MITSEGKKGESGIDLAGSSVLDRDGQRGLLGGSVLQTETCMK